MTFWKREKTECTRYYYSDEMLFEKSLDVYKPIVHQPAASSEKENNSPQNNNGNATITQQQQPLPIVILVVGSGWVGHRAFVYAQTSWWNSSGPKTIASLGTTCVCIRHRGAFCVLPDTQVIVEYLVLVLAVLGALTGGRWDVAIGVTAVLAVIIVLLALGGRGSAQFEDMLEDVAEALQWIDNHRELLEIPSTYNNARSVANKESDTDTTAPLSSDASTSVSLSSTSDSESEHEAAARMARQGSNNSNSNNNSTVATPLVFGGYSSGGHVATMLLHEPQRFQKRGLPTPDKLFQGILMISGMMAVRPEQITVKDCQTRQPIAIGTPQGRPRWLTDFVVRTVWGREGAKTIPSPLAQTTRTPPSLPHLLVGCRNECFGLSWLDIFFCSSAYRDKVQAVTGQPAKYVQVESDHWNILNSTALQNALQEELPLLVANKHE